MPQLANIVIKKADGTTDVTYVGIAASTGNSPAVFRNNTVGTTVAERPSLLIASRDNGTRTARRVDVNYSWPLVEQDSGGNKRVTGRMTGSASVLIPQSQGADVIKEQAHQFGNLMAAAIVKASFEEGYAPR